MRDNEGQPTLASDKETVVCLGLVVHAEYICVAAMASSPQCYSKLRSNKASCKRQPCGNSEVCLLISLTDADGLWAPGLLPTPTAAVLGTEPEAPTTKYEQHDWAAPDQEKGCTAVTPDSMRSGVQGRLANWTPFWGSLVMRFRFQRDAEIRMSGGDIGSRQAGCGADMGQPQYQWCWPASATSGTDLRLLPQTWGKRQALPKRL